MSVIKQILSQHFSVQNAIAGVEGFGRNAMYSLLGFTSAFGAGMDGFTWELYAVELVQQRNVTSEGTATDSSIPVAGRSGRTGGLP